jgi:GT2 family glycosyltransferase
MAIISLSADRDPDDIYLCSVCIANYNGEEYISACIESVLSQDFEYPVEIIVHDDASTDGSVAFIRLRYPQVRLLVSEENVGFCVSNNRMVAAARGNFILLLNNDAVLHNDALKTLYKASQRYGDGIFGLPQYNAMTGELIDIGSTFDLFLNPVPNKNGQQRDVGMIIGACLWLPKALWNKVGGFPEWFGSLAEDMYICCVARLYGYSVKAVTESGFDHLVGRSLGGGKIIHEKLATSIRRRVLSERNKTYTMIVCFPCVLMPAILLGHLLLLLLEGVIISMLHRDMDIFSKIYLQVIPSIWQQRKKLMKVRNLVQRERKVSTVKFFQPFQITPWKLILLYRHGIPKIR